MSRVTFAFSMYSSVGCHAKSDMARRLPCGRAEELDHETVEDVLLRHEDLRRVEDLHDREKNLGPRNDDVNATRLHAFDACSFLVRQHLESPRDAPNVAM